MSLFAQNPYAIGIEPVAGFCHFLREAHPAIPSVVDSGFLSLKDAREECCWVVLRARTRHDAEAQEGQI
jgi:hypothetical protein